MIIDLSANPIGYPDPSGGPMQPTEMGNEYPAYYGTITDNEVALLNPYLNPYIKGNMEE